MIDLIVSQLTDVFRIGLIVALVITTLRTSAITGRLIPLACGVVFVAVMLPLTLPTGAVPLTESILAGLVANLIILVPVLTAASVFQRMRR